MARQNINKGTTANDGTGDTLRVTAGKINDNFSELYTFLGGDSSQVTSKLSLSDSGVVYAGLTYNTVLGFVEGSSKSTILLPNVSGTLSLNDATQTLTNKTLTSPLLTTPQINDTSANHQYIFAVNELTADRTITLPLLTGDDELVFKDHTQTLTNKTLTAPTLTTPVITGHINDVNGSEFLEITPSANAVNHIEISNAATSAIPQLAVHGTDTNIGIGLSGKNAGLVHIQSGIRYNSETVTGNVAVSLQEPVTRFNHSGGTLSGVTLADGSFIGEIKVLVHTANGGGEVTVTPSKFANGTTLHLRAKAVVTCMWLDGTDGWYLMSPKEYASSDADALFYVA